MRATLLADGTGDRALLEILRWMIRSLGHVNWELVFADLSVLPRPPRHLTERVREALRLYPCDVLFVHRDAETASFATRESEILEATNGVSPKAAPIVPVRMTEAWFLFDERAIRRAAGNPAGTAELELPPINRLESLPDPKQTLHDALRKASGLRGRRLSAFRPTAAVHNLSLEIEDFAPLRALPAFVKAETSATTALGRALAGASSGEEA